MRITIADIQQEVVAFYSMPPGSLKGKRRTRKIARPRQIAMTLARELTACSYPKIGMLFGGRDHTTVLHAERRVMKLAAENEKIASDMSQLRVRIAHRAAVRACEITQQQMQQQAA